MSHTFPPTVHLHIMSQKTEETNLFQYKYFMIRTTNVEFETSTTIIPQGNLTSDREIKQDNDNDKIKKTVHEVRFPMSYPYLNDSRNNTK